MKKKRIAISIVFILILSVSLGLFCACNSDPTSVSATVSKDNMTVEIADTMYGIFLEDISFAGDGGLISELVNNGSFEYEANKTAYWRISGDTQIKNSDGLNPSNPSYLSVSANGKITLENLGFVEYYNTLTTKYNKDKMNTPDMGFHKDVKYDVSLYVRIYDFEGSIRAGLKSNSNSERVKFDLSQARLGEWSKIGTTLNSKATEDGSLVLEIEGNGSLDVDFVSLVPQDSYGYEKTSGSTYL